MSWKCILKSFWISNGSSALVLHIHHQLLQCERRMGQWRSVVTIENWMQRQYQTDHPPLRIQHIIDGLGGNQYFTLLDQTKAYHQLHLHPDSQKLTTFIIPWVFMSGWEFLLDWWMPQQHFNDSWSIVWEIFVITLLFLIWTIFWYFPILLMNIYSIFNRYYNVSKKMT